MAEAVKDLKDDLIVVMKALVKQLESSEAEVARNNNHFVGGGWYFDPTRLALDAARYWQTFLVLAHKHEDELKAWVPETSVAAGMQALFTRVAMLWQSRGLDEANHAIDKDVPKFVKTVVRRVEPTKVDAAKAAVQRAEEALATATAKREEAELAEEAAETGSADAKAARDEAEAEANDAVSELEETARQLVLAVQKLRKKK
jgi:hypothetical protein